MPANGGCENAGSEAERDDSVGVLTLDEPETLNAMTPDLLGDLATAIGEMNDDPQVRALVLTGAGRGFCSGQNLKAAQILGDDIAAGVMKYYWPTFKALRECRVPVVVAVNGVAAGGGFSLAMAGDMIVAARSASFIQVFSRIALVPDLGSTWLLPRLVGRQRALELMMTNEPLTADQAKEWGLVREVVRRCRASRRRARPGAQTRERTDARAGRDAPPDRRERTRQLCRSVPPRDRNAGGDPSERRRGGRAQRLPRETCGGVQRTLRKDQAIMGSENVADLIAETLAQAGVKRIFGVVGDSLNGLTDALRKRKAIDWIHVRHEEVAAFAAAG